MSTIPPPYQPERRDQPRRAADRAFDDLYKTFSTANCHSCMERMADGVLLLDNKTRVIYAKQQVDQILKRQDMPFDLSPKFTLHQTAQASRFAAFVNEKKHEAGPLCLLLEGENGGGNCCLPVFNPPTCRTGVENCSLHDHSVRSQFLSFPAMAAFHQTIQFNSG